MSLHLNLQCQRADKNTDTRITPLAEDLEHLAFLRPQQPDRVAVRCGDTPLGPPPNTVKCFFTVSGQFFGFQTKVTLTAPSPAPAAQARWPLRRVQDASPAEIIAMGREGFRIAARQDAIGQLTVSLATCASNASIGRGV